MRLFLYAPESNRILQMVSRMSLRGYNVHTVHRRQFSAEPTAIELQRRIMRGITESDMVVVPQGELSAEMMARLLVVCEFAQRPLVMAEDLPAHAPEDGQLNPMQLPGTRVCMVPPTPPVTLDRMRGRVKLLVERAAKALDHGRWLKNPNSRAAQGL